MNSTLIGMSKAGAVPSKEPDATAGIRFGIELFLLDEALHALIQFLDFRLEQFWHDFEEFLREVGRTNLETGRLLLTR